MELKIKSELIEGVLADISHGIERIADALETFTFHERENMDQNEVNEAVRETAEHSGQMFAEQAAIASEFADIEAKARTEKMRLIEIMSSLNALLDRIAKVIKTERESEPEAEKAAAVQTANDNLPVVAALVHGIRFPDELAICGALGTKSQPFAAKPGERVARDLIEITCPKCREIIEANQ